MIFYRLWLGFNQNASKSYLSVSMIRKYIFTALVIIWGQQDGPDAVIWLFILQFFYLVYLGLVRPFRSNIDNIIEISLESVYFIILTLLVFQTQSEKSLEWEKAVPYLLLILCISKLQSLSIVLVKMQYLIKFLVLIAKHIDTNFDLKL